MRFIKFRVPVSPAPKVLRIARRATLWQIKSTTVFGMYSETGGSTKEILDYQDVEVEGFASTFGSPTERDRGGDYVMPGAWRDTLSIFKKNPVMLVDHQNTTESVVGSWSHFYVTAKGLAVRGKVSNAPGMRDLRFKLVEGHLRALSIGGVWHYANDGAGIEDVDLFEISLVPVPMNPDTLITSDRR